MIASPKGYGRAPSRSVHVGEPNMRQQTWFAVVICVLSVIPGTIAGAGLAYIYRISAYVMVGDAPDFFWSRVLFGLEAPGQLYRWVLFSGFPVFVHGVLTGLIAILSTNFFCKGANLRIAAVFAGALYTGLSVGVIVISLVFIIMRRGTALSEYTDLADSLAVSVILLAGLWVGLLTGIASVPAAAPISNEKS
jgi:hypothetical protein